LRLGADPGGVGGIKPPYPRNSIGGKGEGGGGERGSKEEKRREKKEGAREPQAPILPPPLVETNLAMSCGYNTTRGGNYNCHNNRNTRKLNRYVLHLDPLPVQRHLEKSLAGYLSIEKEQSIPVGNSIGTRLN